MRSRGLVMALTLVVAVLLLPISAAAISVYELTVPNAALESSLIPPYQTPFGTVTVDLDSATTATVSVTVSDLNKYSLVADGAFGVNVNASSFDCSNLTYGPGTATIKKGKKGDTIVELVTWAGAGNEDGFGKFNLTFTGPPNAGGANDVDYISFLITNTSGTAWGNSDQVLIINDKKNQMLAAAHIAVAQEGRFITGFVGDSPEPISPSHAPVPPAIYLLGSGLALGALRRRPRKR